MFLIYFLSFAQLEKKKMNKQRKKTVTMVLLKLFFFLLDYYYCYCFVVGTKLFLPMFFIIRETSNPSEECREERGEEDGQVSLVSSCLLGEGLGQVFFNRWGGCFWCFVCPKSLWPVGDGEVG